MVKFRESIQTGLSFGLTSGTITTLGLMIGLYSGTGSRAVVLGGIITIAVADALSDALGIHISEESKEGNTQKIVWEATLATFFVKFFYALTFVVPVLLLPLQAAVIVGVAWGFLVLSLLSYSIAKNQKESPYKTVFEHAFIMLLVIIISHLVGDLVNKFFG